MDDLKKRKPSSSVWISGHKHKRIEDCLNATDKVMHTSTIDKENPQRSERNCSTIDLVLDHKVINNRVFYLVKKKDKMSAAWLSGDEVTGSPDVLYYQQVVVAGMGLAPEVVSMFVRDLVSRRPRDALTLTRLCCLAYNCSEEKVRTLPLSFDEMAEKALRLPTPRLLEQKRRPLLQLMRFAEERKRVLADLADWERRINLASPPYITVENDVDLEGAPTSYTFISDYESSYVDLSARPAVSCSCAANCKEEREPCCADAQGGARPYDTQGRVRLPPGHELYECNRGCTCDPQVCPSRVVQRGPQVSLCIFRTGDGRGWGLRSCESLGRGQFVLEYLGEVITPQDAEVRDGAYDFTGATYLFDLAGGAFTVDAAHRGNASRFINHSCDPNLQVYCVWGEQQDPLLPRLAFFARRRVRPGEELTFDYKMDDTAADYITAAGGEGRIRCKCGARNCRGYLF